ncbi:hypothetical protein [Bacillus cereus]|uniref:hypothetical protein n=1 Tax=Bacillus cereus TaxID=1396 RepID=UPI000951DFCA|nr:hypothetical protein [Bacillus cereus]OLR27623.1 hypothetical protein BLD50_00860 [Bacillus cereus]
MAVRREDSYLLIDPRGHQDEKVVFDFLKFLVQCSKQKPVDWEKIDCAEPDDEILSKLERKQFNSEERYVSRE